MQYPSDSPTAAGSDPGPGLTDLHGPLPIPAIHHRAVDHRLSSAVASLLSCLLAIACQPTARTSERTSLLPDRAPEVFAPGDLYATETVFDWDFRQGVPKAAGQDFGPDLEVRPGQGLVLRGPVDLRWPVSLDASELDALHVTLLYPHGSEAELLWRRQGENFDPARSLRQRRGDGRAGLSRTLTFEMSSHPGWEGAITELRLLFGLGPEETRILEEIRGFGYRLEPETLRESAKRAWLVDLGHEYRTALLAPPGHPIERQVRFAGEGSLRFAYGVGTGAFERIDFRIKQLAAEGSAQVLFEAALEPNEPRQWWDQRIAVTGQGMVRLVFETSSAGLSRAMPWWGNLELVPDDIEEGRPNVILISVDTLRADHLPLYGYGDDTAPHLTRWARRFATTFDHTVVQAPWTLPSHTSLLTGINATRHGVNHTHTVVPERLPMLAESLRGAGYSTAAVTGGGFLHPKYGFAQGFDRFRYWPTLGEPESELENGVDRALDLLDSLTPPYFLFLHTFDVHDYLIYRRAAGAENSIVTWYDDRIRHTDAELGRLLDRLAELGLRGRTVIALTSDHGEALGDAGVRGHGFLSDDNLRVPLVLELPDGRGAGRHVARQVRSVDLAPTLLELAGLPRPRGIDGQSLLPLLENEASSFPDVASSYAAKRNLGLALTGDGRWRYIFPNTAWTAARGEDHLYDLRSKPEENVDLAPHDPALEGWRELARRELENLPGIRLRFTNTLTQTLFFRLRSRMLSDEGVKSSALPCSCVTREQSFQTLIETPPGTDFEIQLEEIADDPLVVEAWSKTVEGEIVFRESVRVAPSQPLWHLRFKNGRWRSNSSQEATATSGLTVRWQPGLHPSPIATDPDLQQRLRALGYLD